MTHGTVDDVERMAIDGLYALMAKCHSPWYYQRAVEQLQRRFLNDTRPDVQSLATSSSRLERLTR